MEHETQIAFQCGRKVAKIQPEHANSTFKVPGPEFKQRDLAVRSHH